jgi:hypothetical protein
MNAPDTRRPRTPARNALLTACSILVTLLCFEVAFRIAAMLAERGDIEDVLRSIPEIEAGQEVGLGEIIRRSHNRKIVYELAPDLSVMFMGAPLTTNSRGFRGRERPTKKPDGTLRILGIGDSVMFGWGVADDESYLAILERLLNEAPVEWRFEVVNMAVPGYNGVMEVEALEEKGLKLDPDIVVVGFVGNDLKLPAFIWTDEDCLSLRQSFLWRFVQMRLGRAEGDFDVGLEPPQDRKGDSRLAWAGKDLPNLPPRYRDLVGKAAYRRAMEKLRDLARQHEFDVLVTAVPGIPRKALELFEGLEFDLVDPKPAIERFIRDNGIEDWRGSVLAVSPQDPHPSKVANALVAECLRDHILRALAPRDGPSVE